MGILGIFLQMCSYQRLWCSVLSFETHTIVHNFVLCISLDNMRRIIFAIACITLMVRPPLDHLPNPSLCWPKIDNLLKCSANHVQHEDTEPHEHCDIYHWCGKTLRMLGWRFLCSLTLCWLLTGLHVFSNHHTINILQFRTWLSTPLTPIAYCMITDLSYQYKHEYYSIRCITNRNNHHEYTSFVHCKGFDVFPVIHEPQLHMRGQQISQQFAVATDWTCCTNTQLIDCDITDIKKQSRFVFLALRTGQCETALFGCKQMQVEKIPFVNDDSVSFPQNIQWIKPDCIDTHGSTMIPFEHFYSTIWSPYVMVLPHHALNLTFKAINKHTLHFTLFYVYS